MFGYPHPELRRPASARASLRADRSNRRGDPDCFVGHSPPRNDNLFAVHARAGVPLTPSLSRWEREKGGAATKTLSRRERVRAERTGEGDKGAWRRDCGRQARSRSERALCAEKTRAETLLWSKLRGRRLA